METTEKFHNLEPEKQSIIAFVFAARLEVPQKEELILKILMLGNPTIVFSKSKIIAGETYFRLDEDSKILMAVLIEQYLQ